MGKVECERERGREGEASRARSSNEIGATSPVGGSRRDASEASCTASCRSCSERDRAARELNNTKRLRSQEQHERPRRRETEGARVPSGHQAETRGLGPGAWVGPRGTSKIGSADRSVSKSPKRCRSAASGTRVEQRRNRVCARWTH